VLRNLRERQCAPELALDSEVDIMAKILLVEDENVINMVMQNRVEGMGHAVCGTAATGQEAIEQAEAKQPDVVIMDITLKGKMDGIEAATRIQERFGFPVIYMTAYDDEETRKRAGATDPVAYLVKAVDDIDLQFAIEKALRKGKERPPGEALSPAEDSPEMHSRQHVSDDTVRATSPAETQR
jgi:CheY-like chemotaxis protein